MVLGLVFPLDSMLKGFKVLGVLGIFKIGPEAMFCLVKALPHKHRDVNSDSQNSHKSHSGWFW